MSTNAESVPDVFLPTTTLAAFSPVEALERAPAAPRLTKHETRKTQQSMSEEYFTMRLSIDYGE
jgi:hypothetical protein